MRIHSVTMTGFGPFRDTELVDFDAFGGDGIFLITGRTGAGKTSVLDAVCYALFGSVPRYEGGAEVSVRSNFLNDDQPCRVCLEFTVAETRYRATRSTGYLRAKSRGEGTTPVKPAARLDQWADGDWQTLETQVRDVQHRLDEVVRLNADQFRQVVLLAQGQFQEFLVANSDNRSKLLRRLFGTERFVSYREELDRRARDLSCLVKESRAALERRAADLARLANTDPPVADPGAEMLDWAETVVDTQSEAVAQASSRKIALTDELEAARTRYEETKSVADRQARRARELERKERLDSETASVDADRQRLDAARRAELAVQAVTGWKEAAATLAADSQKIHTAESAYLAVWPSLPADTADVSRSVECLTQQVGLLRGAVEDERALAELEIKRVAAHRELADHDERVKEDEARRAAVRAEAAVLAGRAEELAQQAGALPMARLREKEAADRHLAAQKAEQLTSELDAALTDVLRAGEQLTDTSGRRDALRRRQLDGYAGVLAETLEPGQPCAVCGSPEHPQPAQIGEDHVGEAALAIAEQDVEDAIEASRAADGRASALKERLAAETQHCSGLSTAEAAAQLALATAEVVDLSAIAQEAEVAGAAHQQLVVEVEALNGAIERAGAARGELVAAATGADERLAQVAARVEAARADYATVAQRLDDIEARCSVGQRLIAAQQAAAAAAKTESRLRATLTEVLERTQFATADDAVRANLDDPEVAGLTQRVAAHEADSAAVAMMLADPELQGLPDEPADLTGPESVVKGVQNELDAADQALSSARPILELMLGAADEMRSITRKFDEVATRHAVVTRLSASVRGDAPNTMNMELEAFVLAAELEDIVRAANLRLRTMTSGRYELQHSDALARYRASSGLSLKVLDAHTGEARSPESLSGGEKFQASLALALGLAEVVTSRAGGMRLDTLFIDEGFGSLDSDTLETTMATLDSLREGGRTVGLISHVEALRETVPAQLHVKVVAGGWSVIDQPGDQTCPRRAEEVA